MHYLHLINLDARISNNSRIVITLIDSIVSPVFCFIFQLTYMHVRMNRHLYPQYQPLPRKTLGLGKHDGSKGHEGP